MLKLVLTCDAPRCDQTFVMSATEHQPYSEAKSAGWRIDDDGDCCPTCRKRKEDENA